MVDPIRLKIGTTVRILPKKVGDRLPGKLSKLLSEDSFGICLDYKITDGQGIGFVLEFSDGTRKWFFEEEVDTTEQVLVNLKVIFKI